MTTQLNRLIGFACLALAACLACVHFGVVDVSGWRPGLPSILSPAKTPAVARVTYVYEKDATTISAPIMAGLNRLNRERGIVATAIDADVLDGNGEMPDQYRKAIPAAIEAGLPVVVVESVDKVLRVVKVTTESQLLESVP